MPSGFAALDAELPGGGWPRRALTELLRGTDIVVVSDEVYEPIVFDGARHESVSRHPELSSRHILTMKWIDGTPLDQFADSDARQAERDSIGQALWDFYAHQVHDLNLFHADPHPGNFLVRGGNLCVLDRKSVV